MKADKQDLYASVLGALAGACFVAITQLAVKSDPQPLDRRALCFFAAALPLLLGTSMIFREGLPKTRALSWMVMLAAVGGFVLTVAGMNNMIQAVSLYGTFFFCLSALIALGIMKLSDIDRR